MAGARIRSTIVENVLVGVFGAFVAGDLFTALVSHAASDAGFQPAALLPAVGGAGLATALVAVMRRAVGPLKNSKAKSGRR